MDSIWEVPFNKEGPILSFPFLILIGWSAAAWAGWWKLRVSTEGKDPGTDGYRVSLPT